MPYCAAGVAQKQISSIAKVKSKKVKGKSKKAKSKKLC
jgi:hypothetical protein